MEEVALEHQDQELLFHYYTDLELCCSLRRDINVPELYVFMCVTFKLVHNDGQLLKKILLSMGSTV